MQDRAHRSSLLYSLISQMELIQNFPWNAATSQFFGALVENLFGCCQILYDSEGGHSDEELAKDLLDLACRIKATKDHYWKATRADFRDFLLAPRLFVDPPTIESVVEAKGWSHAQMHHSTRLHMLMRFVETFLLLQMFKGDGGCKIGSFDINRERLKERLEHVLDLSSEILIYRLGKKYTSITTAMDSWLEKLLEVSVPESDEQ